MYDAPQLYRWKDPALPPNMPALQVYFLQEPQVNAKATAETGIQTYDSVLVAYVSPINSKSNTAHEIERTLPDGTVVVNQSKAAKYAEQVKLFKAGLGAETQGTPLKDLIGMTPATIMNLKARGIHTIEMLADMPDASGHDMMGFWALRDQARSHMAKREKDAPMLRLDAMELALKQENESLKRQLEELKAALAAPAPLAPTSMAQIALERTEQPEKRGPGRPRKEQEAA